MYITVCSDCLDAASMPQGPQDMCGLTSYELCMMLHEAGLAGAKGMDFRGDLSGYSELPDRRT